MNPAAVTITQEGKPLADAVVSLSSGEKWLVGGRTDANGIAELRTEGQFSGAPAGTYKVAVSKTETTGGYQGPPGASRIPSANDEVKAYDCVEAKYKDAGTSGLVMEVKAGKNTAAFDVGKAVKTEVKLTGM